jgi:hypothetical protein
MFNELHKINFSIHILTSMNILNIRMTETESEMLVAILLSDLIILSSPMWQSWRL